MSFGRDEWMLNRDQRAAWMRRTALVKLVERIFRTPATAAEGFRCVLDEVLGRVPHTLDAQLDAVVDSETKSVGRWLAHALSAAHAKRVDIMTVALRVGDARPYPVDFAISSVPYVVNEDGWVPEIVFRGDAVLYPSLLEHVMTTAERMEPAVREPAALLFPLALQSFLARDALERLPSSSLRLVDHVVVSTSAGVWLRVPLPKRKRDGEE